MDTPQSPIWSIDQLWQIKYAPPSFLSVHTSGPMAGHYNPSADKSKHWQLARPGSRSKSFKNFDKALAECQKRNWRDDGIRLSIYGDYTDRPIPVYDSTGEYLSDLSSPPFNYSFDELHAMPIVEKLSVSNLKLREAKYAVYLDRMDIASYRKNCDDPNITAAGFLPSRLVWVYEQTLNNKLVAIYLATGEDDGFMPQRQQILRDEIENAIEV